MLKRCVTLSARAACLALVCALAPAARSEPVAAASKERGIHELRTSFEVKNTNSSDLPCASDRSTYTVRGHLVGPRSAFKGRAPEVVTLYVHGFVITESSWRFDGVRGYNHVAAMAKRGHVSLSIERIGWDEQARPHGYLTCIGSAADVLHQIVGDLRTGAYEVAGTEPIAFARVVVAGHEAGGAVAQLATYSFAGVDGLLVVGYHNQGITDGAIQEFVRGTTKCGTGGEDAETNSPGGGYVAATPEYIRASDFYNADSAVVDAVLERTEKNPCGEFTSLAGEFATGPAGLGTVTIPVLLIQPDHDNVADPDGAAAQQDHYSSSGDVTFVMLDETGHFPMFERTAPVFRDVISDWLTERWPASS